MGEGEKGEGAGIGVINAPKAKEEKREYFGGEYDESLSDPFKVDKLWQGKYRQQEIETNQKLEEFRDLTSEQINTMPIKEYSRFLTTLSHATTPLSYRIALKHIEVIIDRFGEDIKAGTAEDVSMEYSLVAKDIGIATSYILPELEARASEVIGQNLREKFFSYTESDNRDIRYYSLVTLENIFRGPSSEYDEMKSRLLGAFEDDLLHPKYEEDEQMEIVFNGAVKPVLFNEFNNFQSKGFKSYLTRIYKAADVSEVRRITKIVGGMAGLDTVVEILREGAETDSDLKAKFNNVQEVFIPTGTKGTVVMKDMYGDIQIKDYKPNEEVNEFETELLLKELPENGKVLVYGCGTGREVAGLFQHGRDVYGFDAFDKHVAQARELYPDLVARVNVGAWPDNIPFEKSSFKGITIMGRTFLHNPDVESARACLLSVSGMLTDDGIAIVDLPDLTKGHYKRERARFRESAKELGVEYHEAGSTWDSPDEQHFVKRFTPTDIQFRAMAILSGLKAELIATKEFHTQFNGEDELNVNKYWKLTKYEPTKWDIEWAWDYIDDDLIFEDHEVAV